jgi:hypothetical protein
MQDESRPLTDAERQQALEIAAQLRADPELLERTARQRFDEIAAAAGLTTPDWPIGTQAVCDILRATEYRCDVADLLGMLDRQEIDVPRVGGRLTWTASCVAVAMGLLESLRRWQWPSRRHGWKFTVPERMAAEARAADAGCPFDDLDDWTVEQLLHLLEQVESREVRHAIRVACEWKLREGA